jgi:tRNA (guanine9-N1)-methyltransferase
MATIWSQRMQEAKDRFQICIDCSFEGLMTEREIASLVQQIRYCYAYNKKSTNPCLVAVTGLESNGMTRKLLEKEAGFSMWHQRSFACTNMSLEEYYGDEDQQPEQQFSKIVYLTSDSTTTLRRLHDEKIYVIGGIVDRNRLKRRAIDRAEKLGVATAKLPLDDYLSKMPYTKVLTCNHVFDILLQYRTKGNDWSKALQQVLPSRKHAEVIMTSPGNTCRTSSKAKDGS